jgi:hypothetical protein
VVRFSGGQAAGDVGILELNTRDNHEKNLYPELGLQFVPFSPKSNRSISEMFMERRNEKEKFCK